MNEFTITKTEIGADRWPFTVDEVAVQVDDIQAIYAKVGKWFYNLNGIAKKGMPLENIWLDDPGIPGAKIPIGFIFKMCRDRGLAP